MSISSSNLRRMWPRWVTVTVKWRATPLMNTLYTYLCKTLLSIKYKLDIPTTSQWFDIIYIFTLTIKWMIAMNIYYNLYTTSQWYLHSLYIHNYGSSLLLHSSMPVECSTPSCNCSMHHHPQSCNGGDWVVTVRGCRDRTKILARQKQVPTCMNSDACCI